MVEAGIEEARKDLGGIVDRARFKGEHTVITRAGKPAAVVVDVAWHERAKATLGEEAFPAPGSVTEYARSPAAH